MPGVLLKCFLTKNISTCANKRIPRKALKRKFFLSSGKNINSFLLFVLTLIMLLKCIENLSPEIVIHRLTGDGPKNLLIAPVWSLHKRKVLNTISHEMKILDIKQGDLL